MLVYILLESSGLYEDYRESVHSVYLDKNKCELEKNNLELEMKLSLQESHKCNECICGYGSVEEETCLSCSTMLNYNIKPSHCLECQKKIVEMYCDKAKVSICGHEGHKYLECDERISMFWDDECHYRIIEKEIVE